MLLSSQWGMLVRIELTLISLILLTLPHAFLLSQGSQLVDQVIDLLLLGLDLDTVIRLHIVEFIQEVLQLLPLSLTFGL